MSNDTLIFPRCGLTYGDVLTCKGMRMEDAARRLGVNYQHLSEVAKKLGFTNLFAGRNRYRFVSSDVVFPHHNITIEDIKSCEGLLKKDAAVILGVGYCAFVTKIKKYPELDRLFPSRGGEAWWKAREGYVTP